MRTELMNAKQKIDLIMSFNQKVLATWTREQLTEEILRESRDYYKQEVEKHGEEILDEFLMAWGIE